LSCFPLCYLFTFCVFFFFSSRRRHTRCYRDWSSDVCSSDLDFLARADVLAACGMTVLVSDYFQYYRLAAYLSWRTRERIGIVLGVPSIYELFDEKYYTDLPGGILENFGRLLKNDLKIYVYPLQ